jgi:hypothetical protein
MNLGCSATPVGFAMSLAGTAVNDVDREQQAKELVGARVAQADAKFGAPVEILSDTRSSRQWRLYAVPMDPMKSMRYVLEVHNDTIIALYKSQQYSDPIEYQAMLAVLRPKVMGKSPSECQANLNMGSALLAVRSRTTGQLIQLYDARAIKELQSPHYCVLRFGARNACEKINLVKVYAAAGADPTRQ